MTTVRARIYIAIDPEGKWAAYGAYNLDERDAFGVVLECIDNGERRYFVEVDLPVPLTAALPLAGELTPLASET